MVFLTNLAALYLSLVGDSRIHSYFRLLNEAAVQDISKPCWWWTILTTLTTLTTMITLTTMTTMTPTLTKKSVQNCDVTTVSYSFLLNVLLCSCWIINSSSSRPSSKSKSSSSQMFYAVLLLLLQDQKLRNRTLRQPSPSCKLLVLMVIMIIITTTFAFINDCDWEIF